MTATSNTSEEPFRLEPVTSFAEEIAAYERSATVEVWEGPAFPVTYRALGAGPTLLLCPGIAASHRSQAALLNRWATRFQTVIVDYPGQDPGQDLDLRAITHQQIGAILPALIGARNLGPAHLVGISFGSTVVLRALAEAEIQDTTFLYADRAALQGGFAHRPLRAVERLALMVGRRFRGRVGDLPLNRIAVHWTQRHFFRGLDNGAWETYTLENCVTPIAALAHRLDLLGSLDLRMHLDAIRPEVFLLHGACDPLVPVTSYHLLQDRLLKSRGRLFPEAGHQLHYTHAAEMARVIGNALLGFNSEREPDERGKIDDRVDDLRPEP